MVFERELEGGWKVERLFKKGCIWAILNYCSALVWWLSGGQLGFVTRVLIIFVLYHLMNLNWILVVYTLYGSNILVLFYLRKKTFWYFFTQKKKIFGTLLNLLFICLLSLNLFIYLLWLKPIYAGTILVLEIHIKTSIYFWCNDFFTSISVCWV